MLCVVIGMAGGLVALLGEQLYMRWRARRVAKKQVKVGSEAQFLALLREAKRLKVDSEAQFLALLREAKRLGISLPPEAKELIRDERTPPDDGPWDPG
jgi:hypothetical protein